MNLKRMALRIMIALNLMSTPQQTTPQCINPDFEQEVKKYLLFTIPTISVADAQDQKSEYIFLDARNQEEYNISHIPGATYIGYKSFDEEILNQFPKDAKFIVYCSIGYRSEKIGEKIKAAGYNNVSNLYGSIFEWVNQHYPVINNQGEETNRLHTYNKNWSKWVDNKIIKKIY